MDMVVCILKKEKAFLSKHNPKFWSWGENRVWKYNGKNSLL